MKYHFHLLASAEEALASIFFDERYADKAIEYYLRQNKKWGSRDRRFFAELVYDCVRWWSLYWRYLGKKPNEESVLQILAISLVERGLPMPEFDEFKNLNPENWQKTKDSIQQAWVKESIPEWLYKYCEEDMGEKWPVTLAALNKPNQLVVRHNPLLCSREELLEALKELPRETRKHTHCPSGVIFDSRYNVFSTPLFKKGWFEVQDGSSQLVAPFMDLKPGQRVVDACAGAGGKTLHIASLLENKGKVIALDIHEWKLGELKKRARRNKISNIESRVIESQKVIKRLKGSADRVLLDVPCTGLGVLRRNPDTKWKLSESRIAELIQLQAEILQNYSQMVKPGGKLIYATCSLLKAENEHQIKNFLKQNGDLWKLEKQMRIYPNRKGFDGFYMASLTRK